MISPPLNTFIFFEKEPNFFCKGDLYIGKHRMSNFCVNINILKVGFYLTMEVTLSLFNFIKKYITKK